MTSTPLLGVLMIEDEALIILGIKASLRNSHDRFRVTGSFCNVEETLEKIQKTTFDIILLDLWIKKASPADNVSKLKLAFPGKPIVVFTNEDSEEWKEKMLKAGVAAFVSKSSVPSELIAILHKAYCGEAILKTRKETRFDYEYTESPNAIRFKKDNLPILHKEIIELLSGGFGIKEIAHKKCKSISGINKILFKLRTTFHVCNNAGLVNLFYS
jgi:two-component system, NarL family, invasion response regulator UvrY